MKRPAKKQAKEAAEKSKRAALDSGIYKYRYMMQLTLEQLKNLPKDFLYADYCALCERYNHLGRMCPLRDVDCKGTCVSEWREMSNALESLKNTTLNEEHYYNYFMSNCAQIYIKLLKLRGTI